ncbi:MAG TPA: transcriptional repressor [Anaerolineaceae bacterium]|nr:transcriptional repressor [Anaerolineaceae bacterium]
MKNIWIDKLKEKGMRITAQREAIVDILSQSDKALEPIEVYDLTRQNHPTLGMVTVYRTMECLEELGLLQKVHQDSGCNKYLKVKEGHNHLLICRGCGKAIYFEGLDMEMQFEGIAQQHNFNLEDHWLQLNGLCQQCQASGR